MNFDILKHDLCHKWLIHNYEPLYNLHSALQQIALKFFKMIPQRKIHQCKDIESALRLLEKWKLLANNRLDIIIELSELLNGPTDSIRDELMKVNSRYESVSFCQCYDNQFLNSQPRNHENSYRELTSFVSKYEPIYIYLSENMGANQCWIDLGRMLPGMRSRTEDLRNESGLRQKDKIIKLLEEFETSFEGVNAIHVLLQCLEKRQLRRQTDFIKENYAYLL